jgi:hypothetical protein
MNVGRLAWRTPTGAMLWEIWGQHRMKFLWEGVALAASCFFVHWKTHGASEAVGDLLGIAAFFCFLGAYGQLLICLGNFEVEAGRVQFSFPGRRLFKPVSTARLVLVPMLFGGAVVVMIFALWAELAWRHMAGFTTSDLVWTSTVLLSFFWWMQALAWSLPWVRGSELVIITLGVIHFLVWRLSSLLAIIAPGRTLAPAWLWGILAALLLSALTVAWVGLKLVRQGSWEDPSRISTLWSRLLLGQGRARRKSFGSALRAQFWLEWRRQGWLLPVISGGIPLLMLPFLLKLFQWVGTDTVPPEVILSMLILPLVLSVLLAPTLAKFDPLRSLGDLPVYVAVRPMTNGGFVMAKLAMALATSALTWLCTLVPTFFWLALMGKKAGLVTPFGPLAYTTGCLPLSLLLLLVIWTWKNLVAGISAGLTERTWMVGVSVYCRSLFLVALFPLVDSARTNVHFREALLHWLPAILIVCLAAKIAVSVAAFVWGLRRNAITPRAIGWMIGGWLVCGLFVAGCAGQVCNTIRQPDLWIWVALGGFLILPLADLALAPLALAWNRHR